MSDISLSSIVSSTASAVGKQVSDLNKAASATSASFASALNKVQTAVGVKPKTGFTAGPTYEANTIAGQTKAAFNNTIDATKAALHIK
ncbi:hypothetical protein [Bradyrhizobium sp. dw_411]|uniref:hypothetical protein n=1 Tax=Bradyrhizobium sp. dw_411 TaxID=2720082 RepID=UPI001BCD4409|nr:hypothetical protein [Bradyrhizobium sp. dw_411]